MRIAMGIVGDRQFTDYQFFSKVIRDEMERFPNCSIEIITGDCSGTDAMALDWAISNGIPYTVYCASKHNWERLLKDDVNAVLCSDWRRDGSAAGPKRNELLVAAVDTIVLFDGGGPGSASVRQIAARVGKPVELFEITRWKPATDHDRLVRVGI